MKLMYLEPHEIYQVALAFLLLTYKVAGINQVNTSWELNETCRDMSDGSLSYQKKGLLVWHRLFRFFPLCKKMLRIFFLFICYLILFLFFWKVGVIPKERWMRYDNDSGHQGPFRVTQPIYNKILTAQSDIIYKVMLQSISHIFHITFLDEGWIATQIRSFLSHYEFLSGPKIRLSGGLLEKWCTMTLPSSMPGLHWPKCYFTLFAKKCNLSCSH